MERAARDGGRRYEPSCRRFRANGVREYIYGARPLQAAATNLPQHGVFSTRPAKSNPKQNRSAARGNQSPISWIARGGANAGHRFYRCSERDGVLCGFMRSKEEYKVNSVRGDLGIELLPDFIIEVVLFLSV
ncbi:uncharacterized protein [Triticum aestivum]|uniref:uncharacterized protein n=1 Tax=Triticum aestivum TaxID=4565 RepID=UPI001D011E49|nr:uncharacterized protein LOC123091422 [Triticum aestivum]XP_044394368.1 uncharacterized protein LOC123117744 [Triticum aestivum]